MVCQFWPIQFWPILFFCVLWLVLVGKCSVVVCFCLFVLLCCCVVVLLCCCVVVLFCAVFGRTPPPPAGHPPKISPTRPGRRGSHTTARELQTCTFVRPGASNTTKIPRKRPKEREKRMKNCGGRGKKSAKFWAPTVRAPTLRGRGPTLRALTFSGFGPHLSGPHFFWVWPPTLWGPTMTPKMLAKKMDWPKLDWPKLVKSGWPKRDWPKSASSDIHRCFPRDDTVRLNFVHGLVRAVYNF